MKRDGRFSLATGDRMDRDNFRLLVITSFTVLLWAGVFVLFAALVGPL